MDTPLLAAQSIDRLHLTGADVTPYCSILLLRDTLARDGAPLMSPARLVEMLASHHRSLRDWTVLPEVEIAHSLEPNPDEGASWSSAIVRTTRSPSWLKAETTLVDVGHELLMVGARGDLVAIHGPGSFLDAVRKAVRQRRLGRFRLLDAALLQAALATGDARAMYLAAVHRRRRTRPDAKVVLGVAVQDTLAPGVDSTFYASAYRGDAGEGFPVGTSLGVSPSKSSVWIKRTTSFDEFETLTMAVLERVTAAFDDPPRPSPFPILAREQGSLAGVAHPFEMQSAYPDELDPTESDDVRDAAELLSEVGFEVEPARDGTSPKIRVLRRDVLLLECVGRLHETGPDIDLVFEDWASTDWPVARPFREAMRHKQLLGIHFLSGHTWRDSRVFVSTVPEAQFPRWEWGDFTGFDVCREKPGDPFDPSQIGTPGDDSLFGWVAGRLLPRGYLTCDDGTGEIADFVHASADGRVTLVHVKAAHRRVRRQVATTPYEQVTAQATKNLARASVPGVIAALQRKAVAPTWVDGDRDDHARIEMIEWLGLLDRGAPVDVVIVQPHITRSLRDAALVGERADNHRLRLVETMLNSARSAVTGHAGDLVVWGAAS